MFERVIYTPEAEDDIARSYAWYEERETGLGEDFLNRVEECVRVIRQYPFRFPVAVPGFRRALLTRFPFELFYEPRKDDVIVYAYFIARAIPRNGPCGCLPAGEPPSTQARHESSDKRKRFELDRRPSEAENLRSCYQMGI